MHRFCVRTVQVFGFEIGRTVSRTVNRTGLSMAYEDADEVWKWRQVVRHPECDLSTGARHVLHALALFVNGKTGKCNPSVETIARTTGLGPSTVHRKVKELESAGLLRRIKRRGQSNFYVPEIPERLAGPPWSSIPFRPLPF